MLKIAICDDSEFLRKETANQLFEYFMQNKVDYKIKQFSCGEALLEEINEFDLVFLDYQFEDKGKDGLSIAREIRKINHDVAIIFLSSYTSIVFDTFEVAAFRFLVKPLEKSKLFAVMDDYLKSINDDNVLTIKSEGISYYIKESQISYIEGNGKKCIIHYLNKDKVVECNETLAAVEERLSEGKFYRCHKSFLVNLQYIDNYSHSDLTLQNGEIVMISRQKYKGVCNAYSEYLAKSVR